ncbi:hypothetical protein HF285_09885 [Acidithiobacillus ferrooxidans F221]|uniref:hypothetical protein n=1 Tax=Acidithiobacillus ferrooxidans TaxID=920 RepID=UPI001C07035E|nr:hypothetical protein [Acidithiobacillus ferrooxidans]MBU2808559.1 hypothetical protein [Acidithiobacillus ferrooxidans F221]
MSEEAENTRTAIDKAINNWNDRRLAAAGLQEALPDIERVGIPAIDAALPHLKPNGDFARYTFLCGLYYILGERPDALEASERRKKAASEAINHIHKAAALLDIADNPMLATLLYSIGEHANAAQYGQVQPMSIYAGNTRTRQVGVLLNARYTLDAGTAAFAGQRGGKARDANIVKAIAQYFPDSQGFFSRQDGYSIIANLAVLCGLKTKNPAVYVRSVLESNKWRTKEEAPNPRRDNSIAALFTGNKPT